MTKDPTEPHAGRSAELQQLLDEAARANTPTRPAQATHTAERTARDIHGRPPPVGVSRSVRLAAQRSAEQHHRPGPRAAATRPGHSSRQLPVSRRTGISIGAARWRATTSRVFKYRQADEATVPTPPSPVPPTDHGSRRSVAADTGAQVSSNGGHPAQPPPRTRQRAFVLAAGMAAAVVAAVAIAVGGRAATAPASDGSPPAPTTRISVGTTVGQTSSTRSPAIRPRVTRTAAPPDRGAGETATVVTGVSKLTGWVTLTAPQG